MNQQNTILERNIISKNAYDISKEKEYFRIPMVSDTMFYTMISNSKRIKYAAFMIALTLEIPYEEVMKDIIVVNNQLDHDKINDPKRCVDFLCKIKGDYVGIEMNNNGYKKSTLERNIAYVTDTYKMEAKKGNTRYHFKKVIQININNFVFEGTKDTVEEYFLRNKKGEILTGKLEFIYIYLPLIKEKYYNNLELTLLEKFMLVANEEEEELVRELCGDDEIMKEYLEDSIVISKDEDVINLYSEERKRISEEEEMKETIKQMCLKEGREEGKKENQIETAKKMLEENLNLVLISRCTGLSESEIEELKNEMK